MFLIELDQYKSHGRAAIVAMFNEMDREAFMFLLSVEDDIASLSAVCRQIPPWQTELKRIVLAALNKLRRNARTKANTRPAIPRLLLSQAALSYPFHTKKSK